MTKVELVERQIEALSPEELATLRRWFAAHDADEWDRQIEADAISGRLDDMAEVALAEHRSSQARSMAGFLKSRRDYAETNTNVDWGTGVSRPESGRAPDATVP